MPLDIGVGILNALYVSHNFSIPLTPSLVVIGIVAALLPDIDIITTLWGPWRHREITHYPIVYVPILVLIYFIFGLPYAILFFLGIGAHFIHDTIGIGWGISWLWPITDRKYLFFASGGRRKRYSWFMSWLPKDQNNIVEDSTPGHESWIVRYYLRPSVLGAIEYGFLLVSLVILYITQFR